MRTPEDRLLLTLHMSAIADLDWERIEADPLWEMVCVNTQTKEEALVKYFSEYMRQVLLFTNMPCTNGPSSIYIERIEVTNGQQTEGGGTE